MSEISASSQFGAQMVDGGKGPYQSTKLLGLNFPQRTGTSILSKICSRHGARITTIGTPNTLFPITAGYVDTFINSCAINTRENIKYKVSVRHKTFYYIKCYFRATCFDLL